MTTLASVSLPVVIANVPVAVSAFELGFEPKLSAASSTVVSDPSATITVGSEFATRWMVTVAVEVSPSPSVMV